MQHNICCVIGVGPGNGAALARRFAAEGYRVALVARDAKALAGFGRDIPGSTAFPADVTDAAAVERLFVDIRQQLGPVSVVLYNAGGGAFKSAEDAAPEEFEAAWRVNTLGLFLAARAALPQLREAGGGSLVVTGAGAALRGRARTAPFAAAKAAQRSLAQSLARQLGPEGIHVAYVLIDGVVDLPRTRQALPDKPDDFFLNPDHLAETVYHMTRQPRSAWTFELDLRPYGEAW